MNNEPAKRVNALYIRLVRREAPDFSVTTEPWDQETEASAAARPDWAKSVLDHRY